MHATKRLLLLALILALIGSCSLVLVADTGENVKAKSERAPTAQATPSNTQSFEYTKLEMKTALSKVGKLYGVRVLSEQGIKGAVTAKATDATIDAALTIVTATNGLEWREFVLPVNPTEEVTAQTLDELKDALDAIQFSGILMQGPQLETPMVVVCTEAAKELVGSQAPEGSEYTHYYYVYDPTVAKEKQPGRVFGLADPKQQTDYDQTYQWFNDLDETMKKELLYQYVSDIEPVELPDGLSFIDGKMFDSEGNEIPSGFDDNGADKVIFGNGN